MKTWVFALAAIAIAYFTIGESVGTIGIVIVAIIIVFATLWIDDWLRLRRKPKKKNGSALATVAGAALGPEAGALMKLIHQLRQRNDQLEHRVKKVEQGDGGCLWGCFWWLCFFLVLGLIVFTFVPIVTTNQKQVVNPDTTTAANDTTTDTTPKVETSANEIVAWAKSEKLNPDLWVAVQKLALLSRDQKTGKPNPSDNKQTGYRIDPFTVVSIYAGEISADSSSIPAGKINPMEAGMWGQTLAWTGISNRFPKESVAEKLKVWQDESDEAIRQHEGLTKIFGQKCLQEKYPGITAKNVYGSSAGAIGIPQGMPAQSYKLMSDWIDSGSHCYDPYNDYESIAEFTIRYLIRTYALYTDAATARAKAYNSYNPGGPSWYFQTLTSTAVRLEASYRAKFGDRDVTAYLTPENIVKAQEKPAATLDQTQKTGTVTPAVVEVKVTGLVAYIMWSRSVDQRLENFKSAIDNLSKNGIAGWLTTNSAELKTVSEMVWSLWDFGHGVIHGTKDMAESYAAFLDAARGDGTSILDAASVVPQAIVSNGDNGNQPPPNQNQQSTTDTVANSDKFTVMPVNGTIGAYGGKVDYMSCGYHYARDIGAPVGTPLLAPRDGEVVHVGNWWNASGEVNADHGGVGGGPHTIVLKHSEKVYTVYEHNSKALVKIGDKVKAGQKIGEIGDFGYSFGGHLHWEMIVGLEFSGNWANPFTNGCAYYVDPMDRKYWAQPGQQPAKPAGAQTTTQPNTAAPVKPTAGPTAAPQQNKPSNWPGAATPTKSTNPAVQPTAVPKPAQQPATTAGGYNIVEKGPGAGKVAWNYETFRKAITGEGLGNTQLVINWVTTAQIQQVTEFAVQGTTGELTNKHLEIWLAYDWTPPLTGASAEKAAVHELNHEMLRLQGKPFRDTDPGVGQQCPTCPDEITILKSKYGNFLK